MQVYVRQPKPPTDAASAPHHPPSQGNIPPETHTHRHSTSLFKKPNRFCFPAIFTSQDFVFVPTSFFQAVQVSYWQDALTNELIAFEAKSNMGIHASSYQCLCN